MSAEEATAAPAVEQSQSEDTVAQVESEQKEKEATEEPKAVTSMFANSRCTNISPSRHYSSASSGSWSNITETYTCRGLFAIPDLRSEP